MMTTIILLRLNNWQCERACVGISSLDNSVVSMAGDTIISSVCDTAVNVRTGQTIWSRDQHPDTILVSSCTAIVTNGDSGVVTGYDCINGTTLPDNLLEDTSNFTMLMSAFHVSLSSSSLV